MFNRVALNLSTAMCLLGVADHASAAAISTPALATVRIWESTGPFVPYDFAAAGASMTGRYGLGVLGPASNDFASLPVENYDVYYSDADGTFNRNGNYISVECDFPVVTPQPGGGGLNLGAVDLLRSDGSLIARADLLVSWYGRGTNYIAGSELLAVDPADAATTSTVPTTDTTMGNTALGGDPLLAPLRVTVGFSGLSVPEPGTATLLVVGTAIGVGVLRCGRRPTGVAA